MKIKEFCDNYQAQSFMITKNGIDEKIEYLRAQLDVREYMPFADKRELCLAVVDACCTKDGSIIKVDSVSRYIVFTISVISAYTALEFSSGEEYDSIEEYDMLCKVGLLNPILALIGEEYATCNNMLNMMIEDVITNNNTIEAILGHELGKVSGSIDRLVNALATKVEKLELDLSQIDIESLKGILNLIPKK